MPGALRQFSSRPVVASGRALLLAMLVMFALDVVGGFFALASGAHGWSETWGFDTKYAVPLPVAIVQLLLAWLAFRNVRPPTGLIAAVVLAVFCAISELAGMFDGDLSEKVTSEGWLSWVVAWAIVLLIANAVVCVLAAVRARQLRRPSTLG